MISPNPSQPRNQAQLLFVIPVNRYKQVVTPINGIREYFLTKARIARMIADNQKTISDIFGVARSIYVTLFAARSASAEKSKLKMSGK
jgi:hypothetical protein